MPFRKGKHNTTCFVCSSVHRGRDHKGVVSVILLGAFSKRNELMKVIDSKTLLRLGDP